MDGHPDSQGEGGFSLPDGLLSVVAALVGGHAIVGIQPVEGPLALADGIPGELGMGVGELVGQPGVVVAVAGVQVAAEAAGDLVEGPVAELSTAELRAERDRLHRQLDEAPRDRGRELTRATTHRQQAEAGLAASHQPSGRQRAGMHGWLRRGSDQPAEVPGGPAVAAQQVNRVHDRERELRQHQQRRYGWLEANTHLGPQYRQVVRTLAWQWRATGIAVEQERPGYVLEALGPVPASTRGRRAWRQAAAEIEQYRHTYHITDLERALGPDPGDPAQRADRQRAARPSTGPTPSSAPPTLAATPS